MNSAAPIVCFSRRYRFSASHRLHAPGLTDEENRATYGKCNNRFGHGHNYMVEVTVSGPVRTETGFVVDLPQLDALAHREIVDRFDGMHLNADPAFAGNVPPSTENLAFEIQRALLKAMPSLGVRLARLRIEETGNNSFELEGEPWPPR